MWEEPKDESLNLDNSTGTDIHTPDSTASDRTHLDMGKSILDTYDHPSLPSDMKKLTPIRTEVRRERDAIINELKNVFEVEFKNKVKDYLRTSYRLHRITKQAYSAHKDIE